MKDLSFLTEKLIAHRGFFNNKEGIPENSVLAFKKAIDNNYNIELDLHLLKDGNIVVFHDDNLKRMTGINKEIKNCTYEEIKKLKLLETNQKIPLFEEVLNIIDGKVSILIELKYDVKVGLLEKKTCEILKNYKGKYAIQSFNPKTIYWLKKNFPEIVRGQLASDFQNKDMCKIKKYFMSRMFTNIFTKPDFVSYGINSIEKLAPNIRKNVKLFGWTVKTKKQYEKYVEICDNLICENFNFIDKMP